MHIEIITTPTHRLEDAGFGSARVGSDLLDALRASQHSVLLSVCASPPDLVRVARRAPDLVILATKFLAQGGVEDIWLSEFFACARVNFTGSTRAALRFDEEKISAKKRVAHAGLRTARFFAATPQEFGCEDELPLPFPLFAKPSSAANGKGVDDHSFLTTFAEFEAKTASLFDRFGGRPALVEEYLEGPEYTVSVIDGGPEGLRAFAVEVVPPRSKPGPRILSESVKRANAVQLWAVESTELRTRLEAFACAAFTCLDARDFARIDIKANASGELFFMEASLVPAMSRPSSYFTRACEVSDQCSYEEVLQLIIAAAARRGRHRPEA